MSPLIRRGMVFAVRKVGSGLVQQLQQVPDSRLGTCLSLHHHVEKIVVGQLQQSVKCLHFMFAKRGVVFFPEPGENQIEFEQPTARSPFQPLGCSFVHRFPVSTNQLLHSLPPRPARATGAGTGSFLYTARFTICSLILPIASVGLSPFGQTSTQFMMLWQRNNRYGSSRLSSRPLVAWSRLSAINR